MRKYILVCLLFMLMIPVILSSQNQEMVYEGVLNNKDNIIKIQNQDLGFISKMSNLLDSVSFYSVKYKKLMEGNPKNLYHAYNYINNYANAAAMCLIVQDGDKALTYSDSLFNESKKILQNYSWAEGREEYLLIQIAPLTSYALKIQSYIMIGDFDSGLFYLESMKRKVDESDGNRVALAALALTIHLDFAIINIALNNCNEALVSSEKLKSVLNSWVGELQKIHSPINYYNQILNANSLIFSSLMCTCDSLDERKQNNKRIEFLEENKPFVDLYFSLTDSITILYPEMSPAYESLITKAKRKYYVLLENFDKAEKEMKKSNFHEMTEYQKMHWYMEYAELYVEMGYEYYDKALSKIDSSLIFYDKLYLSIEKRSIYNQFVYSAIAKVKVDILFKIYKKTGDTRSLELADNIIEDFIRTIDMTRSSQVYGLFDNSLESLFSEKYSWAAIQFHYSYKEFGDEDFLKKSITYGDMGKSYLIKKNNETLINHVFGGNAKYSELYRRDKKANDRLSFYKGVISKNPEKIDVLLDSIMKYQNIIKQNRELAKERYPKYYKWKCENSRISIDEIQNELSENIGILNFVVENDITLLHLITKNKVDVIELEGEFEWSGILKKYNISIKEGGMKNYNKYGEKIYSALLEEGLKKMPEIINRLIIIPDGELNELMFGTLPYKEAMGLENSFLIEKYAISYQYSLGNLMLDEIDGNQLYKYNLIIYNPNYINNSESICSNMPLKYSRKFATGISKFIPKSSIINNAKKSDILSNSNQGMVLHFNTHGCLKGMKTPLNYNLLLTEDSSENKELSMSDIYELDTEAQLVILSACESGAGQLKRGIGIHSIARAFHYAGCPNTIATTAIVDEKATLEILKYFYEYLKSDITIDMALRKAKVKFLKQNDTFSQPYFWGNIHFMGNPVKIVFNE